MRKVLVGAAVALVVLLLAGVTWQRGRQAPVLESGQGSPPGEARVSEPADVTVSTLLAAGDVADCGDGAGATGRLLSELDGVVAVLGDVAYPDGSAAAFADCYDPAWGGLVDRTRPVQGNHDVRTAGAAGYYGYFGEQAGPEPQGYYSYDLGAWHVVALNSNCAQVGGCGPDSPQVVWLREDLAATRTENVLAYWHHPRFSTGQHGDDSDVATFWDVLAAAGADVVLNGHDHDYQRFAPLDPDGRRDAGGMREFVVGTGGAGLRAFRTERDTVQYRQNERLGVLRLDLEACGYRWAFLPADGGDALDAGQAGGTCGTGASIEDAP